MAQHLAAREREPRCARGREPRWATPAAAFLLAGVFALLASWSWRKWGDVQIDWGVELYNAWRLAEGDRLYLDLEYRHGALSPYWNALLFRVFGASMGTLVAANLVVLAAISALFFEIFRRARDAGTALLTGVVFLGVFAFSQYTDIGNYNYVTPYLHHQTHGLLLALACLCALDRALERGGERGGRALALLAGFCLGGVFLTKFELFVPAAAAVGAAFAVARASARADGVRVRLASWLGLGVLLLPLGFGFGLAQSSGAASAVAGVLGNWLHLGDVVGDRFYAEISGFDRAGANLAAALRAAVGAALCVALVLAVDRSRALARAPRALLGLGAAAVGLALALQAGSLSPWFELGRGLPIGCAAAAVALGWVRLRNGDERSAPLFVLAVFALGLLAKMGLHARFHHYGFVLAAPATLVVVAWLASDVPRRFASRSGFARAALVAIVLAGVVVHLRWTNRIYERKTVRFEPCESLGAECSGDWMWVEPARRDTRARALTLALEKLRPLMGPEDTLLVLPEGAALNFWLRRPSPAPYMLYNPTELAAFGGAAAVADRLRAHPPDFVALLDRPLSEFGLGRFGQSDATGKPILDWVHENYRPIARVGPEPFSGSGEFGLELRRRARTGPAAHSR